MKVIVFHRYYGCDSGCCGHAIDVDGEELKDSFTFSHEWRGRDNFRAFAEALVTEKMGAEHVKDLDWENCVITDDC